MKINITWNHITNSDGSITHVSHAEFVEEAGDKEKELEHCRDISNFLDSYGHSGNIWKRRAYAIEESIERKHNNSVDIHTKR